MDSSFVGDVFDPTKCHKLSMEKRRDIVYELAKWSHGAEAMLQTWSRQDILQILCAEMGKERKYTGLTKLKMIEQLLKVVSENNSRDHESVVCEPHPSPSVSQKRSKRSSRKPEHLYRLLNSASATNISACNTDGDTGCATYCKNSACKARFNNGDVFCKRCTCCICHKYDDNKDPSLWLTCGSDPPFPGDACNLSCHLECALEHGRAGIARDGRVAQLDGAFYCVSCGKMNDLMRCWRKQLMVAKETRRVDILCYRICLSQKLLCGTKIYQKLSETVDEGARKLEAELGTLSGGPVKMGRGIVNRMSSGQEVQRLCASAVESFDLITCYTPSHQDSQIHSPATNWSSFSSPSSVEDETTNITTCCDLNENKTEDYFDYYTTTNKMVDPDSSNEPLNSTDASHNPIPSCGSDEEHATGKVGSIDQSDVTQLGTGLVSDGQTDKGSNDLDKSDQLMQPSVGPETGLPVTPNRKESLKSLSKAKDGNLGKEHERSSSKKRRSQTRDEEHVGDGNDLAGSNLEYYIKVIRWLECVGHIDKSFRQNFLTWYCSRATPRETRIVKAFVDTLIEDPVSLSEQLVDTFGEIVSSKRSPDIPHGLCLKLWH
ncbi:VIN3-like protein 2 [Silene latifolia]|uniref:VIN3-like protein 2 n=1 Tax=Silene latifolia TaxID=37657 RepID=UPI003D774721